MKYEIQPLFDDPWCRIVFVQDGETAKQLENAILEHHPEYRYEINHAFDNERKLGPLTVKNNKKLWDILMHTRVIREVQATPGMGRQPAQMHFLRREMSRLDLEAYEHRVPAALSYLQKERASILYDVLNGRKELLINDFHYPDGRSNGCTLLSWMRTYEGFEWSPCELIWITPTPFQEVLDREGEETIRALKGYYSFFTVENGRVILLDRDKLLAGKEAPLTKTVAQPPRRQEPAATRPASAPTRAEGPTTPAPKKDEENVRVTTVRYGDNVYTGPVLNGVPHGKGKMTSADGDVYEGDFLDGVPHGKGKVTLTDGNVYEGDFADGNRTGKGKYTSADGHVYEGDFVDDLFYGKGKLTLDNGVVYEGDFVGGKPHGKGRYTYADGDVYEGDFVDGERHGKGTYTFANGDVYEGDFVDGNRTGKGKYTSADGHVYEGDFADGKFHGKGKVTLTDGNVYEGDFADAKFHGKGKYTFANGAVYEGDYVNGNRTGKGKYTFANGAVYEGDFVDGKFHGKGKYTLADGLVYEGRFENDIPV